jgi:hypothetical protein
MGEFGRLEGLAPGCEPWLFISGCKGGKRRQKRACCPRYQNMKTSSISTPSVYPAGSAPHRGAALCRIISLPKKSIVDSWECRWRTGLFQIIQRKWLISRILLTDFLHHVARFISKAGTIGCRIRRRPGAVVHVCQRKCTIKYCLNVVFVLLFICANSITSRYAPF